MDITGLIACAAEGFGTDKESFKSEISYAIDRCYESDDPEVAFRLQRLFPKKPSPEEFILRLVCIIKTGQRI